MENINTDKLYKFISQASILFLLFLIVYLMYIDFIREKMSNKKIYQSSLQEKFNNLISNNEEKITFDKNDLTGLTLQNMKRKKSDVIEDFIAIDPKLKYIIKRNYNIINNAKCLSGDYYDTVESKCYMAVNNFYPTQTYLNTAINIYPLPDFIVDPDKNKKTFYANIKDETGKIVSYNDYIKPDGQNEINLGYKSNYFNFSNFKGSRKFDLNNPLELKIIQYFARYDKYRAYLSKYKEIDNDTINAILMNNQSNNLNSIFQKKVAIFKESIVNDIQNMLLLKSSYRDTFNLPVNIHDIKQSLIKYYEQFFSNPTDKYKDTDLIISDKSVLTLLIDPKTKSDDINNITIYSIIFKININIQLINLAPIFKDKSLNPKLLTSLSSLDYLEYAINSNYIYSYENVISFPIALPFNLPNLTTITTPITDDKSKLSKAVDISDTKWFDDIKVYVNTLFIENQIQQRYNQYKINSDIVTSIMNGVNKIKNDINNLSNISDIFACYIPDNNIYTSITGQFCIIIIFNSTQNNNVSDLGRVLTIKNDYDPNFCEDPKGTLFNNKCLPGCPDGYNIDLGLICLKSDISNFTPNSDFCAQLNSLKPSIIDNSILKALFDGCNPDNINNISNESLFNINKIDGVEQVNKNNYILNNEFNDISLISSQNDDDSTSDSIFSLSFNNVANVPANVQETKKDSSLQHFGNIPQSIATRKQSTRYDIKSREETKPEINKQTGKKIVHFSPFLN